MSTDAIVVLKNDHKQIREVFGDFEKLGDAAGNQGRAGREDDRAAHRAHLHRERGHVSAGRALLPDLEDDILESYEEHDVADVWSPSWTPCSRGTSGSPPRRPCSSRTSATTWRRRRTTGSRRFATGWAGRPSRRSAPRWKANAKAPRKPSQPSALKKTLDAVIS